MIVYRDDDGTESDITEGVKALYDAVTSSMDWGSGFLTVEDALPIAELARVCGFDEWQEAVRYVAAQAASDEQRTFLLTRMVPGASVAEHDHLEGKPNYGYGSAWSTRCAWPGCPATKTYKQDWRVR